jgi:hypothetical protein
MLPLMLVCTVVGAQEVPYNITTGSGPATRIQARRQADPNIDAAWKYLEGELGYDVVLSSATDVQSMRDGAPFTLTALTFIMQKENTVAAFGILFNIIAPGNGINTTWIGRFSVTSGPPQLTGDYRVHAGAVLDSTASVKDWFERAATAGGGCALLLPFPAAAGFYLPCTFAVFGVLSADAYGWFAEQPRPCEVVGQDVYIRRTADNSSKLSPLGQVSAPTSLLCYQPRGDWVPIKWNEQEGFIAYMYVRYK